jgi:hypothetical protein
MLFSVEMSKDGDSKVVSIRAKDILDACVVARKKHKDWQVGAVTWHLGRPDPEEVEEALSSNRAK